MDQEKAKYVSDKFDLVMEFREGLTPETDRGCALMAAEYLSDQLAELLKAHFVDDAKVCDSVFEGANGVLGTFSSRIDFVYLLGYVGAVARRELHLIRRIRNEFAHEYKPLAFTAQAVESRCRELRAYTLIPDTSPRANFVRTTMGLLAVIHARMSGAAHAAPSKDNPIEIPEEEQEKVKDMVRKLVEELASSAAAEAVSSEEKEPTSVQEPD